MKSNSTKYFCYIEIRDVTRICTAPSYFEHESTFDRYARALLVCVNLLACTKAIIPKLLVLETEGLMITLPSHTDIGLWY